MTRVQKKLSTSTSRNDRPNRSDYVWWIEEHMVTYSATGINENINPMLWIGNNWKWNWKQNVCLEGEQIKELLEFLLSI